MTLEKEIFQRSEILYDQLLLYGFKKVEDTYVFSKNILKDTFQVEIVVTNKNEIQGRIYDLAFHEEYKNFRIENQVGEFVNKVREEYQNILIDIRTHCTIPHFFITGQANRITHFIQSRYGDLPQFLWENSPGYGVFRNPKNNKWYGLLMNIYKGKLDDGNEEVEILNLKLNPEEIRDLLHRDGFYEAYHMNKKNWITILLDDSIQDEEIIKYIIESHQFTENRK